MTKGETEEHYRKMYAHEELAGRIADLHRRARHMAHQRNQAGLQDHGMLNLSTSLRQLDEYLKKYQQYHETGEQYE